MVRHHKNRLNTKQITHWLTIKKTPASFPAGMTHIEIFPTYLLHIYKNWDIKLSITKYEMCTLDFQCYSLTWSLSVSQEET